MNIIEQTNHHYMEKNANFLSYIGDGMGSLINRVRNNASITMLGSGFQPFTVPLGVSFNSSLSTPRIPFLGTKHLLASGVRDMRDQAMNTVWATGAAGLGAGLTMGALNGGVVGYHMGRNHSAHHNY